MLSDILHLAAGLAVPLLLGSSVMFFCDPRRSLNPLFSLALAYGLGMGLLGQWMLLLGTLQWPYGPGTIGLPLLGMSLLIAWAGFRRRAAVMPATGPGTSGNGNRTALTPADLALAVLLLGLVAYHLYYVCWRSWNVPVNLWDEISIIAFKAKVFFYEKFYYRPQRLPHASYPLQVPFMLAWSAFALGRWDEQLVKFFLPATFLAFLSVYYYSLRDLAGRRPALWGIVLLIASNFFIYHATVAYRDFLLLFFNCSAVFLLVRWNGTRKNELLVLAGLFAGFTAFTKMEGLLYLSVQTLLLALLLLKDKTPPGKMFLKRMLPFLAPGWGIGLFYPATRFLAGIHGATQSFAVDFTPASLGRVPVIIREFLANMFLSGNWNIVWLLFILSLWKIRRAGKPSPAGFIVTAVVLFLGTYFLLALLTPNYLSLAGREAPTVLSRVLLHFFPLVPFAVILLNSPAAER